MADEENIDDASSRGADWEVVALTASTYAAAPRSDAIPPDDFRENDFLQEQDSSNEMFMSEHFVFPPHEHENLPLEVDSDEIHYKAESHCRLPAEDEHYNPNEFNKDGSEAELFVARLESQEDEKHSFSRDETDSRQTISLDDENDIAEAFDSSYKNYDMIPDFVKLGRTNDDKDGGSELHGESWWRRHAVSLYKHVKETSTLWSIFMAAALMGLVVLGQQWKREKLQLQQLKWQFSITNEKMGRMLGPVNRLKYALVGGHQHSPLIHGGPASNI